MMLNFVRKLLPRAGDLRSPVRGSRTPPTPATRALLRQPLPFLRSPRALMAERRAWAPRPARPLPCLRKAWQRTEGKSTGTSARPHHPWGPTCPAGQPGLRAGSHLALPGRHPGQLRQERRPDSGGLRPAAGAEGGRPPLLLASVSSPNNGAAHLRRSRLCSAPARPILTAAVPVRRGEAGAQEGSVLSTHVQLGVDPGPGLLSLRPPRQPRQPLEQEEQEVRGWTWGRL